MTTGTPDLNELTAEQLRTRLLEELRGVDAVRSDPVAAAVLAVPRHVFIPEASLVEAYAAGTAYVTKRDEDGAALSSVSAARIQAFMLEQAGIGPGMRVLEVGSGGLNAAMIQELVGPTGLVVSIDIDPDVTARARCCLAASGYDQVLVHEGDGEYGWPPHAPYDRVIITVGTWDIPPAWTDQLAPGGRIVVPLRWAGQTRSIGFDLTDDGTLASRSVQMCGFVPMQGSGAGGELTAPLDSDDARLVYDTGQPIDPDAVGTALKRPGTTVWSGAILPRRTSIDPVWLRIAAEPGAFRIVDPGPHRGIALRTATLVDGDSVAYLTHRPDPANTEHAFDLELGATGHGPRGPRLAARITELIRAWDHDRTALPQITAYPPGTPDHALGGGAVFDKRHRRLHLTYSASATSAPVGHAP
ncbi:hypothetical protein GCM10023205_04750 [Yinghuangia aomiensis]|uniref:Protein-L-isoaspartate O-methyltransferase n=1 Tax=Yinghuangia aomiensis TaxID=676205 RepID=A0ABP9GM04_9ACTN